MTAAQFWPMLLLALFTVTQAVAQESSSPVPSGTANDRPDSPLRFQLMDGSIITGRLSLTALKIDTQFGQLSVPIPALEGFTPGMGSHPQLAKKIVDLVEDLGDDDFNKREAAQKALVELGFQARAELERRREDGDTERRKRIEYILGHLEELDEDSELEDDLDSRPLIQRDMVRTGEFTIVGDIVPDAFTIESMYGTLSVKLSDIRRVFRDSSASQELRASIAVSGTNLVFTTFYKSKIRVQRGDHVAITAGGTITMTPWGNNATSTPDGAPNFGWYVPNQIPGGALVAKISSRGTVFKVGSKHSFTAGRSGTLYFAIAMQANYANKQFPGQYDVKVHVKRKSSAFGTGM